MAVFWFGVGVLVGGAAVLVWHEATKGPKPTTGGNGDNGNETPPPP